MKRPATPTLQSGYAKVSVPRNPAMGAGFRGEDSLDLYYEIHGTGRPLVLLHGAFSAIGTSFSAMIPGLAQHHQVIGLEMQGHGHTADIADRPLTIEQMAEDTVAALQEIGIDKADFFGYSMGAGIALQIASAHPEVVNKLVLASVSYNNAGMQPGMIDGMAMLQPEMLIGTPWHDEYLKLNPHPENFPTLVAKMKEMDIHHLPQFSAEQIRRLSAPTLLVIGDSDIIQLEHATAFFRLLGGGVNGDLDGLPTSQLAILPGTSHTMMVTRAAWLVPMVNDFLAAGA